MANLLEDYELVERAVKGDQDAFAELLSRYKNLVYSIVLRMVNNTEEANDLAQEVFIKVYKNLEKYHPDFKFSTWLIRITTNHVIDYRRKKKQDTVSIEEMTAELPTHETPEDAFIKKETYQNISDALAALPDMYRLPLLLFHNKELSYQEISSILGEPLSKIKNRIFRGRKMLREMLAQNAEKEGVKNEM